MYLYLSLHLCTLYLVLYMYLYLSLYLCTLYLAILDMYLQALWSAMQAAWSSTYTYKVKPEDRPSVQRYSSFYGWVGVQEITGAIIPNQTAVLEQSQVQSLCRRYMIA